MAKTTEKQIEQVILEWLNHQPSCFAFKVDTKGTWNKLGFYQHPSKWVLRGTTDIIGLMKGQFFAFEVKTEANRKRFNNNPGLHEQRQQAFIDKVKAVGGIASVVSSIEEVMGILYRQ